MARSAPSFRLLVLVFVATGLAFGTFPGGGQTATPACVTAGEAVTQAKKAVKRAQKAVRKADTKKAKARAQKKLRKAKKKRAAAIDAQRIACMPAPDAPSITGISPSSPANNNSPQVRGNATPGTTVKVYPTPNCSGAPVATGTAAQFASPGLTARVPDNSTTTFRATATNQGGAASGCSQGSQTYVEDSAAPASPMLNATQPASPNESTSPTVQGTADPGSTVKLYTNPTCSGAPAATGDAGTFAGAGLMVQVPNGSTTTFWGTASDAAGNASPCSTTSITYVQQVNQAPSFGSQTLQKVFQREYTIVLGQVRLAAQTEQITLSPGATDPDGDPLSYEWTATNGSITGNGLNATWVREVQNYAVVPGTATITASDGRGGFATYEVH